MLAAFLYRFSLYRFCAQTSLKGSRAREGYLVILFDLLLEIYYGERQSKKNKLQNANLMIEQIRHLLRLSYELKYINAKKLDLLMNQLLEVGRMIGGWLKA